LGGKWESQGARFALLAARSHAGGIWRRNGIAASQSSRLHSFWQSESGARPRTADDDKGSKNFKPGAAFVEPEVRSSANGELNTTLRMQYAYKNIGGYRLYVRTYEGAVPGPTLRLKPGDVLHIKLINDMPPNRDPEPIKSG
jgi:FtsP/CotA-like multicopper oxidase with cupredoxin domain